MELRRGEVAANDVAALRADCENFARNALLSDQFWLDQLSVAHLAGTDPRQLLALLMLCARFTPQGLKRAARRHLSVDQYVDAVWSPEPLTSAPVPQP